MHPELIATMARQHGVFTTRQAREAGCSPDELRSLVRTGAWVNVRRGVLTTADHVAACTTPYARHRLAAAAALLALHCDPVLSHRSAAVLWDLPLLGGAPRDVQLTTERQHARHASGLELHTARTPVSHRTQVDRLPVTTVARTLSDLARSLPLRDAVVAADAAFHRGLCTASDLDAVLHDCWVWRGIVRTKRVRALVDARSESPGESLSRLAIAQAGLPAPVLQHVLTLEGRPVRVDFYWPEHGLVGEFDGRVKYGEAADLWAEKQREDLIRGDGHRVVRWIWQEVHPDPAVFLRRLSAALR